VVPDQYTEAFAAFVNMPEGEMESLLGALTQATPALLISEVADKVAERTSAKPELTRDLLFMLASLERSRSGQPVEKFVSDLLEECKADESFPEGADPDVSSRRLVRALSARAIQVTAKALEVAGDHQRLFCSARVLSDLRPVFTDALDVSGTVIIHQLKISYPEQGPTDATAEIYMSVDRHDLLRLKATVERALQKHEKLADMAEKLNMSLLGGRNR